MSEKNVTQPQPKVQDDRIDRVARAIFAYRFPRDTWSDPLFAGERNDCLALAAQFREMFLDPWTLGNVVERLTDVSCHLVFGDRLLNTGTRGQIKDYAESYVEDLSKLFGDLRAGGSESWRYVPEHEPDASEIEVIPAKVN